MVTSSSSDPAGNGRPLTENGFGALLLQARGGDLQAKGELLRWYFHYLSVLASTQLDRRLRRRLSPSDLVQETMLAAHRDFGAFRGHSQGELIGWLRQILINTLHRNVARHVKAEKRDVRREVSLDRVASRRDDSAWALASMIAGEVESPSAPMRAREDAGDFAQQLGQLSGPYREVIVYRIFHGMTFEEIGERMGRSAGAVRMLWLRALQQFKRQREVPNAR